MAIPKVKSFSQYKETSKKRIVFDGQPIELANPIKLGLTDANSMRSPRYTKLTKLLTAKEVEDLF